MKLNDTPKPTSSPSFFQKSLLCLHLQKDLNLDPQEAFPKGLMGGQLAYFYIKLL